VNRPQDSANRIENFLRRWSRRKQAAERPVPKGNEFTESVDTERPATPTVPAPSEPASASFDPTSLPPLDSITATSDIRDFLAPSVPEELARAALRRVWLADPAIRDFIGPAENQWDFGKPDGVPGFGSLELTPQLRDALAGLLRDAPPRSGPQQPLCPETDKQAAEETEKLHSSSSANSPATQPEPPPLESEGARATNYCESEGKFEHRHPRHGSAIPE
jgi:hypothetical protein